MSKQAINSLDFNNNQYIFTLPYGVCSTGAGTVAKAVSVDNFSLENGSMVTVKFSTANTAANPTLSVNSTDAKPIYYNGAAIDAKKLQGRTYSFVYDGSYWQLIGDIDTDTNTTKFTITATAEDDDVVILTGTNGSNKVTYKAEHTKKGPANGYTSGNTTTSISGSGGTGTIKIPQLTIDEYGHVTAATDENVTITLPTIPTIPSAIKNPNSLKITGNKVQAISYDGSLETSLDFVEGDNVTIASEAGKITISAEDTHHQSKNVITSTNTSKDDSKGVTNGNVHLNLIENNTVRSSHKIKGSGATTVTVDSAGDIVISSTDNDTKYVHPSYTARTGVPTANQTPKFGGTFQVSQPVSDTLGHITAVNSRTITIPNDLATSEAPGLMPPEGIEKLSATNIAYGTCSTAATTVEKAVTIINNDNWVLTTGSLITVKFAETNTATAPKINVNNTGAYPIWYNNAVYESASSYGGYKDRHITYQFNGTHWVFISWSYDTNSDTKVQQDAAITTNGEYPVILAYSTSTSKVTNTVKKTSTLKYNPSTQILTAPTFKGNLIGNVTGNADTATSAGKLGNISVGDEAQPIYFKNGLPVASTSDVGSSLVPIRLKDGTLTECSGIEDTFIQWSNSSISGGLSPVDAAISNLHSANRFSFAKAAGITIEYSRDGGATYTAYPNKTDEDKIQLVSGIGETFYIGAHNTDVTINDKLRVTLNATNMGVYTKLRKLLLQITTQGASGCTVTIETATKGAIDTFTKVKDYNIDGWSGWNSIPMDGIAFGGGTGQTSNIGAIRLTFNITGVSSSYSSALTLMDIVAIGETYWSFPSTMAKTGHLYSYDAAQNATFPGEITATKFNGPATTINTILPLSLGGTGKALTFTPNAIIRFSSTSNANYFSSTPTASGAFYCTSANGSAVFGTLPIAQGGTGATTAANALKNLGVNATATQLNQLATYSFTTTTPSNTSTDTTVPTSKAVYSAIANSFAANDAMRFKGVLNAANDLPATCQIGDTYKVATAGKYAGVKCEIGDIIIAVKDATTANNSNWTVVQANIDGTVILSSTFGDVGSDNQPVYIKGRVATASKYTDWVHAVTSSNTNGCITVKTNDTTDSNVMVYAHPEDYGAKSGGPTGNQTPGFGSTFTIHQMTSDKYGHVTDVTNRTVKIPNTAATQSAAGLMSAADKTKLDSIETGANKYVHPNYTARTGKPTENLIPNFGDTITISQITSDTFGHVTGATDRTITIPSTLATEAVNGLMSLGDKAKLNRTNLGYGTCSTAAATAEKVVTMPSTGNTKWALVPGSQIQVKFSNTNTADSPTLNINGTGAKAIDFNTKLNYLIAGKIYTFVYDGTNYVLLDEYHRVDGLGGNYAEVFNDSSNIANGEYSHAEGRLTEANGDYSHAEGISSIAQGLASHAEGKDSSAEGEASHAEGSSLAIGDYSHAEGGSVAMGNYSHSEGEASSAYGDYSHAEGNSTIAEGEASHAEGIDTEAAGKATHAEGNSSKAEGEASHAEGQGTIASGAAQHVQGKYNIADTTSALIIGNGTSTTRSNAYKIDFSGNSVQAGRLTAVGATLSDNLLILNTQTAQKNQPYMQWATIGVNTPYTGFAHDQNDGTFIILSMENDTTTNGAKDYRNGLSIGGGSGNLFWKGDRVIVGSAATLGSSTKPVYLSEGKLYACDNTLGVNISGVAAKATILETARTIVVNLASQRPASFNGSDNVTLGVTGTLPIANGGTGATTAADVLTNLGITSTAAELNILDGATITISGNTITGNLTGTATNATNSTNAVNATNASKVYVNNTTANNTYYIVGALGQTPGNADIYRAYNASGTANTAGIYFNGSTGVLYGAAWNDYAEYRETKTEIEAGRVVCETGKGDLVLSTERLQPGAEIVSDTFGFAIGETDRCKTPIAASGRVLAYPYEDRNSYQAGDAVCAAPNGTVSKMTDEEICKYPHRIIGTVSEIPEYETWGQTDTPVNGRIWIRIK